MTQKPTIAIVYASVHHGNTRKLAESLSAELSADLFTVNEAENVNLGQYQLVGMGSGIYFGAITRRCAGSRIPVSNHRDGHSSFQQPDCPFCEGFSMQHCEGDWSHEAVRSSLSSAAAAGIQLAPCG